VASVAAKVAASAAVRAVDLAEAKHPKAKAVDLAAVKVALPGVAVDLAADLARPRVVKAVRP